MIKNEIINIRVSNRNISYYRINLPDIKVGDYINVSSIELQNGSNFKIVGICDFCGRERKISKKAYNSQTNFSTEKFTCCKKCSLLKTKETNMEKYGVGNPFQLEEIKNKIKETNIEKYGVGNPQQSLVIKKKRELTNLEKYGYNTPSKCDEVKRKVKKTNNIKFGVDYPAKKQEILDKMKLSCYIRYGVDNFSKTENFKKILSEKNFDKILNMLKIHGDLVSMSNGEYEIKCGECDNNFKILYTLMYNRLLNGDIICTNCNPKKTPIKENKLYTFIKENYYNEILKNNRNIISNELDIYLPDLKLAFEFNGLYWHSELYKEKKYHLNKTKECYNNGIELFHIWEDDWNYRQDIVKSMILNKLGISKSIYARKTEIREIDDRNIVREFLSRNHIQGFVGSSIKLGLFYEDKLVSLMTFGKLRISLGQKSEGGTYELLRFCNALNTNVVGGASKLLKYFISNYNPKEIISYSDNSRSNGNLYKKLGFELKHETGINYYWIVDGIRRHRFNYRKDKLVKQGYDKSKTEIEIMTERGYYRIFDSGSKKWVMYNL